MTAKKLMQQLEDRYRERTPKSAVLHARAKRVMPGGETRSSTYFRPYPLVIEQATGTELVDVDGNRLLDFMNNATTLIHGHRFGPVEEAVRDQVAKGPPGELLTSTRLHWRKFYAAGLHPWTASGLPIRARRPP